MGGSAWGVSARRACENITFPQLRLRTEKIHKITMYADLLDQP